MTAPRQYIWKSLPHTIAETSGCFAQQAFKRAVYTGRSSERLTQVEQAIKAKKTVAMATNSRTEGIESNRKVLESLAPESVINFALPFEWCGYLHLAEFPKLAGQLEAAKKKEAGEKEKALKTVAQTVTRVLISLASNSSGFAKNPARGVESR